MDSALLDRGVKQSGGRKGEGAGSGRGSKKPQFSKDGDAVLSTLLLNWFNKSLSQERKYLGFCVGCSGSVSSRAAKVSVIWIEPIPMILCFCLVQV